jgi:3-oxoacyl-[acyl-carrier-protein] synthase II
MESNNNTIIFSGRAMKQRCARSMCYHSLSMNRIVVTGIGAVSPLGNSLEETWAKAKKGRSGIAPITEFDVNGIPWKVAGTVKDFRADRYLHQKEIIRLDPFVHYAVASAVMATEDAGLTGSEVLQSAGVIIGSSRGGIGTIERALQKKYLSRFTVHPSSLSAYLMPSTTISMASSSVAQKLGVSGYCLGISNACASGLNSIGEAFRLIKCGYPYPVLCGGAEAPVCRTCLEGYGVSGALSKRTDSTASRPFDRSRDGFVLSEGACIVVLETFKSAMKRGAGIYGEIIGYGNTTDSYHQTVPAAEGEARAMRSAIDEAALKPDEIDFISAHGTSTRHGDKTETEAIKRVFGTAAYSIPITSLKSVTGHMLAASGALEAALTLLSLKEGVITPTINLRERDPECDLDYVTECSHVHLKNALSQSFGFGGLNAVLVFRKVDA